ncbi:hypothetical protein ACJW31_11G132200 [Castanea mollissima]
MCKNTSTSSRIFFSFLEISATLSLFELCSLKPLLFTSTFSASSRRTEEREREKNGVFLKLHLAIQRSKRRSSKPSALSATPLTKALVTSKEDVPEEFATLVLNFISRNRIGPHGVDVAAKAKG